MDHNWTQKIFAQSDALRAAIDSQQRMYEQLARATASFSMRSIAEAEFSFSEALLAYKSDWEPIAKAILAAPRPFPNFEFPSWPSVLQPPYESISSLSRAVESAGLLGVVDLDECQTGDEEPEEGISPEVRESIVKVVPASALKTLDRVQFAPLRLLADIYRRPAELHELTPRGFEEFTAMLVEQLGFHSVVLTPPSADGGRDVLARKLVHGIELLFAIECKKYTEGNPVGPDTARCLLGTISTAETQATHGILVTTSRFTRGARKFILSEPRLGGRDFDEVVEWVREAHGDTTNIA